MTLPLIASEVRGVAGGGVTTAQSRRFVVRLPIAMGGVCDTPVAQGRVYMPGLSQIYGNEVAGYARQDAGGNWTYTADTWTNLLLSSGIGDANSCLTTSGADTVGAIADFGRLLISGGTTLGEVIMIYREVELKIDRSQLDPKTLAVYRGVTGDTLREFATGIHARHKIPVQTAECYLPELDHGGIIGFDRKHTRHRVRHRHRLDRRHRLLLL